jgi:hypothetical protein
MKQILQEIKISYFKSLKGEENFWTVFFNWGIFLYISSIITGYCTLYLYWALSKVVEIFHGPLNHLIAEIVYIPVGIIGTLGFTLILIYPFVVIYSLFKCTKKELKYILGTLILLIIFLLIQICLDFFATFGALMFFKSSFTGGILGIVMVVTVMVRTFKALKQK